MTTMKNLFKIFSIALVGLLMSCETTELDLRNNPNQVSPDQADVEFLYNSIQTNFGDFVDRLSEISGEVVRINYMFGRNYQSAYSPANFDTRWEQAYQIMFTDMDVLEPLAIDQLKFYHLGQVQIMKAYTLVALVDTFGDVPLSQAGQPGDFPNPVADPGAEVYSAAIDLLDSALSNLRGESTVGPATDLMYGGNTDGWIKAANSLKMKIYLSTRLTDASAVSKFNAIVSSGNFISSSADDFQFNWSTNPVDPGVSAHPRYLVDYSANGPGNYRSNSLMSYMLGPDKEDYSDDDPRIRYYFYRQRGDTPGQQGVPANASALPCSTQTKPSHYGPDNSFCAPQNGYWGRDHGDDDGIPPDNTSRTAIGVYPAGGRVDANQYENARAGEGGQGGGITPLILASTIDFYRAEIALFVNNSPGNALNFINAGITKSVAKVQSFQSLDTGLDADDQAVLDTVQSVGSFLSQIQSLYNGANDTGKKNIMANQFFVNLYGNSFDGYNFYRRTGFPTNIQPNLEPNPSGFIRSFFYPANEANTNQNINQKPNQTVQVFWDNNPGSPSFPVGN